MDLDRDKLQRDIQALYKAEHDALGSEGTREHLQRGQALAQQHRLTELLGQRGVLVFPHAGVADCGYQIAACVHACLDSGTRTVLVVSVLHAFTQAMEDARRRVAAGGDPATEPFWGIQGPGLPGRQDWQKDHALYSWRYFWHAALEARGLSPEDAPTVIERYPYLAGGKPDKLPGIRALQEFAEDAVIVSTADAFHHGIGYGTPPEEAFHPDDIGLEKAREKLEEGIALLERGDYWGYNQHCVEAKSDARDAGQVFRYLTGPLKGRIVDLTYTDASHLYQTPAPTWVAAALFAYEQRS